LPFDGISIQHFNFIEVYNNIELNNSNQAYLPLNIPHFNYKLDVVLNLKKKSFNQFQAIYHLNIEFDRAWNQHFYFIDLNSNMINSKIIIFNIDINNKELKQF
jgi:hypothetical protein